MTKINLKKLGNNDTFNWRKGTQKALPTAILMKRMPKNCWDDCIFCYDKPIYDDDASYCILLGCFINECPSCRHVNCPLQLDETKKELK